MADSIEKTALPAGLAPTFRDPSGTVVLEADRVLRYLTEEGFASLSDFLQSDLAVELEKAGSIVATRELGQAAGSVPAAPRLDSHRAFPHVVEHQRIPFVSYPSEWTPRQLFDAATLVLDLAEQAIRHGFVLKDATPYNVVFHHAKPVFVDLPSFVRRHPLASAWPAAGQFTRMFLLPLLAGKLGVSAIESTFLTHRDGIEASELRALSGGVKFFRRGYISLVVIPGLLERFSGSGPLTPAWEPKSDSPEKAEYTLQWLLRSFRRQLRAVAPKRSANTHWGDYQQALPSYSAEEFPKKKEFVEKCLADLSPRRVLDIGCNQGLFSKLAVDAGAAVVAFDQDSGVVEGLYQEAHAKGLPILPMVVNLGRPTPAHGWRNREYASFLQRAHGHFDLVIALAVLHHLLATDAVPLPDVLDLFAELTTGHLLLEYVAPQDPHFQAILRGRDAIHAYLNRESFETLASVRFEIVQSLEVKAGLRWVYLLKKR